MAFAGDGLHGVLSQRAWQLFTTRLHQDSVTCHLTRLDSRYVCKLMIVIVKIDKKAVLSQRSPRNAPYTWVPWKISGLPDYAHRYYSQHFSWTFFRSTLWMLLHNLKSVALPVPEIIGWYPRNLGSPWIRPHSLFSTIFNGLLFGLAL